METQLTLFQQPQAIHEKWICQRTIMLGSNHTVNLNDEVIVIERYKDRLFNLDMIVLLHNSARIESIESFFIKHFYILTSGIK